MRWSCGSNPLRREEVTDVYSILTLSPRFWNREHGELSEMNRRYHGGKNQNSLRGGATFVKSNLFLIGYASHGPGHTTRPATEALLGINYVGVERDKTNINLSPPLSPLSSTPPTQIRSIC